MLTANTNDAVNLAINGSFDEKTPQGLVPSAWEIQNAVPNPATFAAESEDESACVTPEPVSEGIIPNFFARISEPVDPPGYRHRLQLIIRSVDPLTPVILGHPCNYLKNNTYVMSRDAEPTAFLYKTPFTVEFSIRVVKGTGTLKFETVDSAGTTQIGSTANLTAGDWNRRNYQFVFDGSLADALCSWQLSMLRTSSAEQLEIELTAFQWVAGYHDFAPFTGDNSYQVTPRNAIVMVMGNACPPGTRTLAEVFPEMAARFALGADMNAGELGGAETHQHGLGYPVNQKIYKFTRDGGEEVMYRNPPHKHEVTDGPSRPHAIAFNYCIKL